MSSSKPPRTTYMHPLLNDDNTRNVYAKTPTEQHFSTLEDFVPPLKAFKRRNRAQDVLSILPTEVQLIRRILPHLIRLRGQEVMLVLGFCLKSDSDEECKTDKIVKALEVGGQNPILFLDLRNGCRRLYDETDCKFISEKEIEVLLASKALGIQIAIQELDITIGRVFPFSPCWDRNRWDGILDVLRLDPFPYYYGTRHISWM